MGLRTLMLAVASAVALLLPLALPSVALAHERRTIGDGRYDVVVGFDKEPAFVDQPNAASIRILRAGTQDPVEGRPGTSNQDDPAAAKMPEAEGEVSRSLATLLAWTWGCAILAGVMAAVLQSAQAGKVGGLGDLAPSLLTLLADTRYGLVFWVRMLLLAFIGALLLFGRRFRNSGRAPANWWWAGTILSSLVLLTVSLGSHAAAGPDPIYETPMDWAHLESVGVWFGGLVALLLALPRLRRALGEGSAIAATHLLAQFSEVASYCLVTIVLTGLYRAIQDVSDWDSLFDTAYGTALLVKLGLVVCVLALAALNLLWVRRRLIFAMGARDPEQLQPVPS